MCAFSTSLTTTVFSQRSMWWFETIPHRTIPEGQQSPISRRVPALIRCLPTDHPLSAYVAHVLMSSDVFDASSAVHLRSPSRSPSDAPCAPFPQRSPQQSLTNAARSEEHT